MDILIAGAGTVGYSLAQTLSFKHNVTVIDKNREKLDKLDEDVDLMVVQGDIEDPKTYQGFELGDIDLFIAVTDSDEANLLSTLIVEDVVYVGKKIIRLKNEGFLKSHLLTKLSIDHAVFPDMTTANKVRALLDLPEANNVKNFHQTRYKLVSVRAGPIEKGVYAAGILGNHEAAVVGIERGRDFFVPSADEQILPDDLLYLFGRVDAIAMIATRVRVKTSTQIRKIVIFGANMLARKIAKALMDKPIQIKMIEKDVDACRLASLELGAKVSVIQSAYEDQRLFEEEGLAMADMVIAAGSNDEKNIVKCIEAKTYGIHRVVAVNNDKSYYGLMHTLGLIVVRGSKASAHYAILEKIDSSSVVTQRHFCGGNGVMFLRKVYADSTLIGKGLKHLGSKEALVLLQREERLVDLREDPLLQEGDIITVFSTITHKEEIRAWIYTL